MSRSRPTSTRAAARWRRCWSSPARCAVGDSIVAGTAYGRVRAMLDEHGDNVEEATPSRPVQVLGLTSVPRAGDTFLVAPDDRTARQIAERREAAERAGDAGQGAASGSAWRTSPRPSRQGKVETLNLILKGDVSGSVEALEDALLQIDVGEEVDLRIIDRGVGAITLNNINLATVDNAIIIGFNVRAEGQDAELADREGVDDPLLLGDLPGDRGDRGGAQGHAQAGVRGGAARHAPRCARCSGRSKFGNIAGCIVRSGEIRRNTKARMLRDGVVVNDNLAIDSLRRFKDDVTEVREGFECGINLGSFNDIQIEDVIETFELREKPRA